MPINVLQHPHCVATTNTLPRPPIHTRNAYEYVSGLAMTSYKFIFPSERHRLFLSIAIYRKYTDKMWRVQNIYRISILCVFFFFGWRQKCATPENKVPIISFFRFIFHFYRLCTLNYSFHIDMEL